MMDDELSQEILEILRSEPLSASARDSSAATTVADERRVEQRYRCRFRCALVYHQHLDVSTRPTYHGTTWDISLSGISFVVGYNVFTDQEITVLLAIPPHRYGEGKRIVECTAVMRHTVYSGEVGDFRIGIAFKNFKGDGRRILRDTLRTRSSA